MSKKPVPAKRPQNGVTWPQAVRDIVVTSINRGQLPVLGIIAIVLLLIWKMPGLEAAALAREIFQALRNGELWAYPLLAGALGGWFFHVKSMRRMFSDEAERIGREKSNLQSKLSGVQYQSSDQK